MRRRNRGTIVQVGSALAFRRIPLQSPYCATKHAMGGFTESLNAEFLADDSDIRMCAVHLPGLNTTQFIWGRNKLPNAPQPVPPIYQPEVAAEAIAWAADQRRRVTYVGGSTALTIWGNRLAKPLMARYLARTNIDAQQTNEPAPGGAGNLFEPQDQFDDHGSHAPSTTKRTTGVLPKRSPVTAAVSPSQRASSPRRSRYAGARLARVLRRGCRRLGTERVDGGSHGRLDRPQCARHRGG